MHGEHLLFEGRKMAKSTGNVVLLRELPARGLDPSPSGSPSWTTATGSR